MPGTKGKSGGKRSGAGRPEGSKNTLDYGEVAALAAAKLRPPPAESPPEVHQLAARGLQRIAEVMEGRVFYQDARNVLAAATRIREEACGLLAQKVEHKHEIQNLTDEQLEARYQDLIAKGAASVSTTLPGGDGTK